MPYQLRCVKTKIQINYLQGPFTFVLFYLNLDTKNCSLKRTIKDIIAFEPQTNVFKAMLQYCQLSGKLIHQDFA